MNWPKISIIIPVYNVEPYISECLQSVMRQTYQGSMESLVVDDCSTDKSIEIAEKLIAEYDGPIEFRMLHHKHNRGLSAARNTGVENANGDYVLFLDSDDHITDDCLDVLTGPLKEKDYDMVLGDVELSPNPRNMSLLGKETGPIFGNKDIFLSFYVRPVLYVVAWNKLVKASLFKGYDLLFLEGQLNEDDLWKYKCCLCLESLFVIKRTTYHYRVRNDSLTSYCEDHTDERLDSYFKTVDYVLSHPAKVGKAVWIKVIVDYMCICSDLIITGKSKCRKEYLALRKRFEYHPVKLFVKKQLSLLELKKRFHFGLPSLLDYSYLIMPRGINRFFIKPCRVLYSSFHGFP